jgi:protein-tyrosine phosphatase
VDEVPDPYYGGESGFENVLNLLEEGCLNLLNELEEQLSTKK